MTTMVCSWQEIWLS